MKKLARWQKVLLGALLAIVLVFAGGFLYLEKSTYSASTAAVNAEQVSQESKDYYYFAAPEKSSINLIFYQGALVEADSYSIWAEQVAQAGYNVYLLKLPLNLAVLGENAAEKIIEENPADTYILAGHSLGGVMASRFTANHLDQVAGMIYLASYPDEKGSLATSDLPVLSLTASDDGVLDWDNYEAAKEYLPSDTNYQSIVGGNHAGFGSYGEQKGDNLAEMSNGEQQIEVATMLIQWLQENFPQNNR
ncbi:alpha/beta hydrolase [Enterococcus sp. HY326]|uniref:alpha/beta hydrolase n=1 Tax=Enterococcus sp. HY326 TaxID=2971265 RepID=UPI0022406B53|nr:alpha/beta hydrolase [Enterococcus sp. HY326]